MTLHCKATKRLSCRLNRRRVDFNIPKKMTKRVSGLNPLKTAHILHGYVDIKSSYKQNSHWGCRFGGFINFGQNQAS